MADSERWTYGATPLPVYGVGLLLLSFGVFLFYVGATHDYRRDRGVRTDGDVTLNRIVGFGCATVICVAGIAAFAGGGVTIDRRHRTVRQWSSFGPFRSGVWHPLGLFHAVVLDRCEKTGRGGSRVVRYRVSLVGKKETPPIIFEDNFLDIPFALKVAQEVRDVTGLALQDQTVPPPPAPPPPPAAAPLSDDLFNRALAVFQAFGPDRAVPVEERWTRELPSISPSQHAGLRARCEEIEAVAAELAGRVLDGDLGQDSGRDELARRFPVLNPDRLSHTWSQALYFAAK